jgi:hypothetical protein
MDSIIPVTHRASINSSHLILEYSLAAIKKTWAPIHPPLNYDQYKKEESLLLKQRASYGFSNFPNIGGNPASG